MKVLPCLLTLLVISLAGCGTETGTSDDSIAEVSQELGEAACGTVAITPNSVQGTILSGYGQCAWTSASVSPNASYGSTSCPGQYVVEFTNTQNSTEAAAFVTVPDSGSLGQLACIMTRIEMGVYGRRIVIVNWPILTIKNVFIGAKVMKGQWIPEFVGPQLTLPAHCEFTTESNTIPSDWRVNHHSIVRVTGRAYQSIFKIVNGQIKFVKMPTPVKVGLTDGNPC